MPTTFRRRLPMIHYGQLSAIHLVENRFRAPTDRSCRRRWPMPQASLFCRANRDAMLRRATNSVQAGPALTGIGGLAAANAAALPFGAWAAGAAPHGVAHLHAILCSVCRKVLETARGIRSGITSPVVNRSLVVNDLLKRLNESLPKRDFSVRDSRIARSTRRRSWRMKP